MTKLDSPEDKGKKNILADINGIDDLKRLRDEDLPQLAEEIRELLIASLAKTGGHLGPNLGVVELSIALHRIFSTPRDKIVFDVSHQGYVHKILTGRRARFQTIRTYKGLCGFLNREESEHDAYGAGHAGTALSAALGFAVARDLAKEDFHVIAVAGDAAFTCGVTMEALNNIASSTRKLIVILNDNKWSIDKNVGAVARIFRDLQTHPAYAAVRSKTAEMLGKVAGHKALELAFRVKEGAKNLLFPSVIFENYGLRYYGPIDGHDIHALTRTLEHVKTLSEPVLLHVITEKGKGYKPALDDPEKFHGLGAYEVSSGRTQKAAPTCSEVFAQTLTDIAEKDDKIVAITAAMPTGTRLEIFKNKLPQRCFDVGIAEEHAAIFAAAMAAQGFRPFLAIYSTFMQRAYDMIVHDVALQRLPVRLCMDRAGLANDDGPTHHGLFDIGYLRNIPGLIHMQPKDEDELAAMLHFMAKYDSGPSAIRYPRGGITGKREATEVVELSLGKAELVADGADVALISLGNMFGLALQTKEELERHNLSVAVINARFIKPFDAELFSKYAGACKAVCVFEDHVVQNGFGQSVATYLRERGISTPVVCVGWPDEFIEHGTVADLRQAHGLTAANAADQILKQIK